MQKKLIAIVGLIFLGLALLQVISGYLINQLKAIPDFTDKDKWVVGALIGLVIFSVLFSVLLWLWQSQASEQTTSVKDIWSDLRQQLITTELGDVVRRLSESLEQLLLIDLQREEQPEQVEQRSYPVTTRMTGWLAPVKELFVNGLRIKTLAPQERMIDVFRRSTIHGRLLILGAPGSGKTMTLLGLAEELLNDASKDSEQPVPILLELSAWREEPIWDWLAAQLKEKYEMKSTVSKHLIEVGKILPLLDGLDEMEMARQRKCVAALNQYLSQDATRRMVVCCRQEEYEQGAVKLSELHGAVRLLPLTDDKIQNHLRRLGKANLWREIRHNPGLSKLLQPDADGTPGLLRTPLFLSVAAAAYTGQVIRNQDDLWHAYLDAKLSLPLKELRRKEYTPTQAPSSRQTLYYLIFLAQQLNRTQTEFLIEHMQPIWLWTEAQQRHYRLVFGLVFGLLVFGLVGGPVFGLVLGLVLGLVFEPVSELVAGSLFGLVIGAVGGLIVGPLFGLIIELDKIQPVEAFQFSITRAVCREILSKTFFVLIIGLSSVLFFALVGWWVVELIMGLFFVLFFGLLVGLVRRLVSELKIDFRMRSIPNQGIRAAFTNSLIVASFALGPTLLLGLLIGPMLIRFFSLQTDIHTAVLSASLIAGLSASSVCIGMYYVGGLAWMQHLALRVVLYFSVQKRGDWETRCIPWNYARFLAYAADRRLIQQVGGRYRFIHRTLMEHLASMRE